MEIFAGARNHRAAHPVPICVVSVAVSAATTCLRAKPKSRSFPTSRCTKPTQCASAWAICAPMLKIASTG
jgi:hypothetical protein